MGDSLYSSGETLPTASAASSSNYYKLCDLLLRQKPLYCTFVRHYVT